MKKITTILTALGIATLTACGNKTDANEKNFGAAINQYFDEGGNLCLNTAFPVDLSEMDLRQQSRAVKEMVALEAAGMVKGEFIEADNPWFMGGHLGGKAKIKVKRYTATDAAKPFVQEKEVIAFMAEPKKQDYLCWGKKALDKVVKWEGPASHGGYQEVRVAYTYKVNNIAAWAKKLEVQAAFPDVKAALDRAGSREYWITLKLTNRGWEN